MKIGYARVSSYGQQLDAQLSRLKDAGCERIYQEKRSAASTKGRPELRSLLDYVRDGDVVFVTRLDRLARSVPDLQMISQELQRKQVELVVLEQHIDTTTSTGRLMFNMLGAIAEFERELIAERAAEGRQKARDRGVRFGPKPKLTEKQIEGLMAELSDPTVSRAKLAEHYGISRTTLYRLVASVTD